MGVRELAIRALLIDGEPEACESMGITSTRGH